MTHEGLTLDSIISEGAKNLGRKGLMDVERLISSQEGAVFGDSDLCPLKHHFSDGVYAREIFIPQGVALVGKIHKDDHHVFLMNGTLLLVTENETKQVVGPCHFISKAGAKRAAIAITDVTWTTIHPNKTNTQNLKKLEEEIISKSYEEFDKYFLKKNKVGLVKKIINFLKL
jgi:hypothetical protein